MNQKQLQYFIEVYHSRNIQAAADKLYVSRQGVSKMIRSIEEELGQPLFSRTSRGCIQRILPRLCFLMPRRC